MSRDPWVKPIVDDPHDDVAAALHDVSNALTVILGWVSEARLEEADSVAVRSALQVIEEQARVARSLARRAIGAESMPLDAEEPVDSVVDSAVRALSVEASRAGVELCVEFGGTLTTIRRGGDVRQILTNLVLNALSFAPRGSRVFADVDTTPSSVMVTVRDEGPGIPPERRATVFSGHTSRASGAGIGLRHARSLARAVGGELELAPSNKGAAFRLTWPRARPPSIAPPPSRRAPVLEGMNVLVVEDDEHVTLLLEAALTSRGASVTVARDLDQFINCIASDRYDVALIDMSPIASDANGAIESFWRTSVGAGVVFISGSAVALPEATAGGPATWVRKPFEVSEVVGAIVGFRDARAATADDSERSLRFR